MRCLCIFAIVLSLLLLGGCTNYRNMRHRDFLDCFTLCVATWINYGVQGRAGGIPLGINYTQESECYGLRGGEIHTGKVYMGGDSFNPDRQKGNLEVCILWMGGGRYDNNDGTLENGYNSLPGYLRGKYYYYTNCGFLPITIPYRVNDNYSGGYKKDTPYPFHHFTQLEILLGLGRANVRVGINPGEMLDFVTGSTGFVDFWGDDIGFSGDDSSPADLKKSHGEGNRDTTSQLEEGGHHEQSRTL